MRISAVSNANVSFSRSLTKKEEEDLLMLEEKAKKKLGTGTTTATIFDFSVPKKKNDTGIGTTFSNDAQDLALFLKTMCGINAIQLQPQGQISNFVRSPYSGTSFSLGMHIIDLNKLQNKNYGNLLKPEDFDTPYMNNTSDKSNVDYESVLSDDGQKAMLKKAYDNFTKLEAESTLKQDFEKFKSDNEYWLEKDALFEAAAAENGSEDETKWPIRDQNIFATKEGDKERIKELKQVTDENGRNVVDFEEFVQFIADKQQKESKEEFNKNGIELYGDCQIGFAQKDVWAHKSAFKEGIEFGCDMGKGKYTCWSPAIDFNKLDGEAGELLKHKFDIAGKRYDGIRIDAAWQLIDPLLVHPLKDKNGNFVFDEKGNKLGFPAESQPWIGKEIISGIALETAEKNGIKPNKIFLEILGGKEAYDSLPSIRHLGTTLIHITKYGDGKWGRVKFYESQGDNEHYQNMNPGDYTIGPGTHDDESLLTQFDKYGSTRAGYLAHDLGLNYNDLLNSREKWADASFAELFTTKNQFATLPDILGSARRINEPDVQQGNWIYRAEPDYKQKYFENLSQGKGLNLPDALSKALRAKGQAPELAKKLENYANILRAPEPKGSTLNINS